MKNMMGGEFPGFLIFCFSGFISFSIYFLSIEMIKILKDKLHAFSGKSRNSGGKILIADPAIGAEPIAGDKTEKGEKTYPELPCIRGRGIL